MVWQGAFIGANALKTLTVEKIILKNEEPFNESVSDRLQHPIGGCYYR